MVTIYRILYNENYSEHKLEGLGLVLVLPSLVIYNTDAFLKDKNFSECLMLFNNNAFDNIIEFFVLWNIGENPLKIEIGGVEENYNNTISNVNALCVPALLKLLGSPLFDKYATILYRFAVTIVKADGIENESETRKLKEIYKLIHNPNLSNIEFSNSYKDKYSNNYKEIEKNNINKSKNKTLDDVLKELNELIGLDTVKKEVYSLVNFINIQKERKKQGLPIQAISYHIVFTGNPGTGKTTVARIVSQIYKHLGILKEGSLIETDRAGLIGEYVGHTAPKVNKVVDSALNNVLFIDEAYSLVSEGSDDYGKEAVATLIKRMEDDRDKLVLIVAGYKDEMNTFIETNPGLKSRFNRFIEFEDYNPDELYKIFVYQCEKLKYVLTAETENKLKNLFEDAYKNRNKFFGNGRFVRNFFEKTIERQSNRIASLAEINKDILITIIAEDILQ
jgi:SpoVK/Ycf46/Vps4 family AAA+-type ATPase